LGRASSGGHRFKAWWTLISFGFKVSGLGNDRVIAHLVHAFFQFTGNAVGVATPLSDGSAIAEGLRLSPYSSLKMSVSSTHSLSRPFPLVYNPAFVYDDVMSETRINLQDAGVERTFILIGTAHISKESIEEVTRMIKEEKSDMVCVELDEGRYNSMTEKDNWERLNVAKILKEGKGFLLIANLVLSGFQRRMGKELGVQPGEEMKAAVMAAKEAGIPFALCDREIQITLRRAWGNCNLWNKCKLLATLLSSAFTTEKMSEAEIEGLKERSELDGMMNELAEYLPPVKVTLIDERDQYLAAKIWANRASATGSTASATTVTVVVGAGHLTGIQTHLEHISAGKESVDVAKLEKIAASGIGSKLLTWLIPFIILALIVAGFLRLGTDVSLSMLVRWLLLNGSLAALGALIALGHPLSVLVSFLGAPIGTLSPVISVGLFSGVLEAIMRKPRVSDAETLIDDVSSLKGIYRNRITHALLVFFLASLGGAIGNFISIPALAGLLIK
jgi:pheromone shutdown-related protein TraB